MDNIKENIEKSKENIKTTVFPTVEQIINDLQFQLLNVNSSEAKKFNSEDIIDNIREISKLKESEKEYFDENGSLQTIIKEKEIIGNEKEMTQNERNNELNTQINYIIDNFININDSLKEFKKVITNSDNVISDLNINIDTIISNINNEINEIKSNQ
ncbi:hypothetical protein BCR36DRAFT_347976 [Piromyces finnis]|uniref:Uncharacterized protein n=1 Tax=Piromyces finnis TaxID=1754191 RepID=A0A1Y1VHA3_9FUNG|nr:hypothetical protein BCR36DRAFT_347976 [Piromyces finnis]|eukprot:ORX54840.1 hypothetical protein BCR36DRAFT_347976 [Piromyces finnis]